MDNLEDKDLIQRYLKGETEAFDFLIEKYFKIPKTKIEKMRDRVRKYTGLAAFLTWLPGIGDAIAVTLGLLKINILRVSFFMTLGKLARYVALVYMWDLFF